MISINPTTLHRLRVPASNLPCFLLQLDTLLSGQENRQRYAFQYEGGLEKEEPRAYKCIFNSLVDEI